MLPLTILVMSELKRMGGTAKDRDLFENVRKLCEALNGQDLSFSRFNKVLMSLELKGFVRVESIKRGYRMVYLVERRKR